MLRSLMHRVRRRLRPPPPPEHEETPAAEKLLTLILLDALRKRAPEVRIVFGHTWTESPFLLSSTLVRTCGVFYVTDGEWQEVMRPPGRMSDGIAESVARWLAREYRPNDSGSNPAEFRFDPKSDFGEGLPLRSATVLVELATENGHAVLILRPV